MKEIDDELWSAIADPSRRRILDGLLAHDDVTQSEIAGHFSLTRQAIAKHLAVLEQSGLITSHRRGREVRYTVQRARVDQASRMMSKMADRWDQRLSKLKQMAEAAHRASDQTTR